MGRALADAHAEARAVFDEAEAALPGLTEIIFDGPEDELTLTQNAQPAILTVSIAAQRVLARRETLGDHVLPHFRTATAQVHHLLARLGPADWDKPHYTPLGSAPLRHIPADWLVELVVHGWDIRSRLASDAHLSAASLPVVVEVSLGRACR